MSKKLCKDTKIKAFSHWHFEFLMARFWAVPVFRNEVWTVWSAYAMAWLSSTAWSTTRPNLPTQKPSWRWRNMSLLTFLAGRTKEQVLDKGIRQKSTKRVRSIVVCSAFCPRSPKRDPLDSEKMACLPKYEFVEKCRKTCVHVLRFTVGKRFACMHVNRRKVVNSAPNTSKCNVRNHGIAPKFMTIFSQLFLTE